MSFKINMIKISILMKNMDLYQALLRL